MNCKGNKSFGSLQAIPQNMGRLLGAPPKKISCADSMKSFDSELKGDPGSLFSFECPVNCSTGGQLIGVGLYAYQSSICMAAVQQNLISNSEGGYVSVVIGYPQLILTKGKNSANIASEPWPDPSDSESPPLFTFVVTKTTTCHLLGTIEERR